jgi:hypothetical protein
MQTPHSYRSAISGSTRVDPPRWNVTGQHHYDKKRDSYCGEDEGIVRE